VLGTRVFDELGIFVTQFFLFGTVLVGDVGAALLRLILLLLVGILEVLFAVGVFGLNTTAVLALTSFLKS